MRSALLCVLFAFIVHKESSLAADEDFRPTPIPLTSWNIGGKDGDAGTLQEALATDAPPAVAAVPAHYWEDALRHSVYLTLVRDKIDQLIAKSPALSDTKPDQPTSKEVDDHDLWEKIKTAPFDRLNAEEPSTLGDIAIMAKGRLLEETKGFRFTEDELTKEKCNEEQCTDTVKAYWSVKRVRQRDTETVPGKHHYELTFSVSSQTPKRPYRSHENPVRTFTVREGTPVEKPQHRPQYGTPSTRIARPQRAIWIHKNIVPTASSQHQTQTQEHGFKRLFSSFFSSEEDMRDTPIKRYRYSHHTYPQRSKVGHVGLQSELHHQKQSVPYTYKPHSYKVVRPLGPPPVQHTQYHYSMDLDAIRHQNHHTTAQTEYKHVTPSAVKSTKPSILPTPSMFPLTNITVKIANISDTIETTTRDSDIITAFTTYTKPKPTKVNYFPEHVRPPIFNAPPGVFVTMDKKPFKPMPPLKYMHSSKPKNKPVDFRPSPQVLDVQFSDPDPLSDAFRPITMSYAGSNTSESNELADSDKYHHFRKTKPPKKHDRVKSQRTTTKTPEIITAFNEALEDMQWANILGAFTKTTTISFQKTNFTETTTTEPFTTVSPKDTEKTITMAPDTEPSTTAKTTTTKPRRTRPPPQFEKPVKVKKHKRLTTTTSTSTTTTEIPSPSIKPIQDLTPQASSTAIGSGSESETLSNVDIENIIVSTTPMSANVSNLTSTLMTTTESSTANVIPTTYRSTTTRQTTTRQKPTLTLKAQSPITEIVSTTPTVHPRDKNRFRQSTLMLKGTSVKHDRWNLPYVNKTTPEKAKLVQNAKFPLRRKGSNFHGYGSSTPKSIDKEQHREHHEDVSNENLNVISIGSSTSETTNEAVSLTVTAPTPTTQEQSVDQSEQTEINNPSTTEYPDPDSDEDADDRESENYEDHDEYIFTTITMEALKETDPSETVNEVEPETLTTTEETVVATSLNYAVKNKTKCKNKKKQNTTVNFDVSKAHSDISEGIPKSPRDIEDEVSVQPITNTEKMSTSDFFDEIFGLTMDQNETGTNHTESKYVDNDDDLEEFLQSINRKTTSTETYDDEYPDNDKEVHDRSPFNNDEDNRFPRHIDRTYDDYQDQPFSLLELMAME